MQQQNDRLRDKYFRELNDGTLTEHREKYPPWPLTDAVKTKKTVTITASEGNKGGNGWQVDHNVLANPTYAAEDSEIIYVDADIKRPKKNVKGGSRMAKRRDEAEKKTKEKISVGAVAGVSTSTKENHPYFYAYDKVDEAVEEEKYVGDVRTAPVAGVSTAGKEPNLQLFYNWDQETETWVRPGGASKRATGGGAKQPLDPNFVAGRKSVSGEVHPYNFGYDQYAYDDETKANSKHVDLNFVAGKKSVSNEVHPYNFSYIAQEDGEEKRKFVADPSFVAGKKSVSNEVHPYNFSYIDQEDGEEKRKFVADPSFVAGKKSVSGEVHPYNFSYIAQENGEEKTKQFVSDPSFVAGKKSVSGEVHPYNFSYIAQEDGEEKTKQFIADPSFIAGKKSVSNEVHPYNFSYIAQEDGEEMTKQFVADPSFIAGKSTVQKEAIFTYFVT